jgi:purine nucleosidase
MSTRTIHVLRALVLAALMLPVAAQHAAAAELTIVDTDFGVPSIDDAFALALALASPELHVVGITTVAGNQKLAVENAQLAYELERLGATAIPVYSGPAAPRDPPAEYRAFLDTPARTSFFPQPARTATATPSGAVRIRREAAAAYIAREVLAHPGRVTIVCIGPLTNVADAIASDPRVAHAIGAIYIGGGYLRSDPYGIASTDMPGSPYAEFNFWVDPAAASRVLRSGAHIVLVPYNVNQQTPYTEAEYRAIAGGHSRFAALVRAFAPQMPRWSGIPALMFDEDVVAALVDPHLTGRHRVRLDVVRVHGSQFGESVAGAASGGDVTVLWQPHADALRTFIATRLSAPASRPAESTYR